MQREPRPSHHVRPDIIVFCEPPSYMYEDLPISGFRMIDGCG